MGVRRRVAEILDIPSEPGDVAGRWFDRFIVSLIVLNVAAVFFETVGDNGERYRTPLLAFEWFSLSVFIAEFLLRLWSVTAKPRYAHPLWGRLRFLATPTALIDLLAILPAFFAFADLRVVRVLRLLRVLRVLKLGRYSDGMVVLTEVIRKKGEALVAAMFVVAVALVLASSLMYYAEHEAQPDKYSSIPHAMYWGIVALTTTGYGDVVPVTDAGKLIAGLTAVVGIGAVALPVGILASGFVEELEARKRGRTCPHCGKPVNGPKSAH